MNEEEIKEYIKNNLVIDVDTDMKHSNGNNMIVSLRFIDDDKAFTEATIYMPEG